MTRGMAATKAAALFAGAAAAIAAAAIAGGCGCGEIDIVGDADADANLDGHDDAGGDSDAWDPAADDAGTDDPDLPDVMGCLPCTASQDPWVRVGPVSPARIANYPSIAWTGSEIGLAGGLYNTIDGMYLILETMSVETLGTGSADPIMQIEVGLRPSLAWSGGGFAMAWEYSQDPTWNEVRFAPWNESGPNPWPGAPVSAEDQWATDAKAVWNGSGYGIAWTDDATGEWAVRFARVDEAGGITGPYTVYSGAGTTSSLPSLAWDGSGYGTVWLELDEDLTRIAFARVAADGTPEGDAVPLTEFRAWQERPAIAWAGSAFAVVWDERVEVDGYLRIKLSLLTPAGSRVGSDVVLDEPGATSEEFWPSVAWGGCEIGVAWHSGGWHLDGDYGQMTFARVTAEGERVGAEIRVAEMETWAYPREISMAWTGSEYAIAWGDYVEGGEVAYVAMVAPCR